MTQQTYKGLGMPLGGNVIFSSLSVEGTAVILGRGLGWWEQSEIS